MFESSARIFLFVVGHESARRNWRTAPKTETGFLIAIALQSKKNAGRAEAGGQRPGSNPRGDPKGRLRPPGTNGLERAQRQVGLESPPVTRGSCGSGRKVGFAATESPRRRESFDVRSVGPIGPQCRTEVRSRVRDPRNGSGRLHRDGRFVRVGPSPMRAGRKHRCGRERNPTAVQSGNRSATPFWVSGRENDSRRTVCACDLARGSAC